MSAKQEFIDIFKENIKRPGSEKLLEWLSQSDFFIAPASTKYHSAFEGGLVQHSLNVYKLLKKRCAEYGITDGESIAICGLLHDICKANFYKASTRNVKNEETGKWEQVPFYTIKEEFPYGSHGGKSVYLMLAHGLQLTDEEAAAINCHMGGWDYTTYHNPSNAFEKYPLAVYLHTADMLATYINKC